MKFSEVNGDPTEIIKFISDFETDIFGEII